MSRLISNPSRDGNSTNCSRTKETDWAGAGPPMRCRASSSPDSGSAGIFLLAPSDFCGIGAAAGAGASRPPRRMPELDSERM